jgi:hypothetical protein
MKMTIVKGLLGFALLASGSTAIPALAQASGCTLEKGTYTCDWQAFRARFAQVHIVAIEPKPMERFIERRLTELAGALGKSVAGPEQTPDAIFRIVPAADAGIAIGPGDQSLAKLEVLAPGPAGSPATLLWVENYVGQEDKPWPSVVTATANQFQARFRAGRR